MKTPLLIYTLLLVSFSIFTYLFVDSNLQYLKNFYTGFSTNNRELTSLIYIIFVFLFFFSYLQILKNIKMFNFSVFRKLLGLISLILVFSYPAFVSFDIFNYIATAKTLFFFHENPYIVMPIEFAGDPLLLFTHAANKIALYGPFWIGLTSIPYLAGFGNFVITLFSFKIFIALFYLGTIYLLWKFTKDLFSISLFALNPLVVIETLVSSHNDIVMVFFTLLSFFLLSKKKILLAILFITLSILIKYATIFLIPIFLYTLLKTIKKEAINWKSIYLFSFFSMLLIFSLSPLREEIYPWYAIWFLPFAILSKNKLVLCISLAFSFGLLFRYVPFMLWGTHFGITPFIKTLVTFSPLALVIIYYFKKRLWLKDF